MSSRVAGERRESRLPDGGNINDERIGAHFVLYPQPFGFQAEWNWGRGPELNAARTAVQEGYLQGGYVQAMYKWNNMMPYVRWQEYNGGKKNRTNSPFNIVRETEVGVEYQFSKALELTVAYSWMKRTDTVNRALSHPRWAGCPFSIAVELLTRRPLWRGDRRHAPFQLGRLS